MSVQFSGPVGFPSLAPLIPAARSLITALAFNRYFAPIEAKSPGTQIRRAVSETAREAFTEELSKNRWQMPRPG